jgi:putative PLP-dependent aminotransferase (TIGR04422 family)
MNNIDYQWPMGAIPAPDEPYAENAKKRSTLHDCLDDFFTHMLGYPVIVMSSGQASLSLVLQYYEANRSQVIYVPKWAAHCLWHVTGSYANPTCTDLQAANIILAVHKYGFVKHYLPNAKQIIIEDSVDSLLCNGNSLFPNGGDFEIVSLPKVMGIYSGALLVCRSRELVKRIRPMTRAFGGLNAYAGRMRYLGSSGKGGPFCDILDTYQIFEWANFSPDYTVLRTIHDHLDALMHNRLVIEKRLSYLYRVAPNLVSQDIKITPGRLPPVIPVPLNSLPPEGVMVRHVNNTQDLGNPLFVKSALIPLHFGISEDRFKDIVAIIKNERLRA